MSTLYLKKQGTVLRKKGDTLVVTKKKKTLLEYPAARIKRVIIMGNVQVTTYAVSYFLKEGIEVFYLSKGGKFRGSLQPSESTSINIRAAQYKAADNNKIALKISRAVVLGKLKNCVSVCRGLSRYKKIMIPPSAKTLEKVITAIPKAGNIDSLRGYEGSGAREYYGILSKFFPYPFRFNGRNRRPPKDPVNVLLSLGYTLLLNVIFSSVKINSLDPYIGFLHSDKKGAPALVLDLMEEWRPMIDYWIIQSLHKKRIVMEHFSKRNDRVKFADKGMKIFFEIFEENLEKRILHQHLGERTSVFRCMNLQSGELSKFFTGKTEKYIPFKIKI